MGGCCTRRLSACCRPIDQERLCKGGLAPSSKICFHVSLLSGSTASIECSDAASVALLQRMVRKQFSI
eukprot:541455-Amphidinium_carterae.1